MSSSGVRVATVRGWNFKCLGYEVDNDGLVSNIFCKTCRDYFMDDDGNIRHSHASSSGSVKDMTEKYIRGTSVVKKVNFANHLAKNKDHEKAARILKERELLRENETLEASGGVCSGQSTINYHVRKLNQRQHLQLQRKFQLAHHTGATAKSFSSYSQFAQFESKYHGVDLGSAYLTRQSCSEIIKFIANDKRLKNITEPLNDGIFHYYSVLCDGSSSTKIVDEKELYIIKTCLNGKPHFQVISLEEPEEGNAEGLAMAMENALKKLQFTFSREEKEIGICSDAAAVNIKLWKLIKEELGEQYFLSKCISHKFELAVGDAFKDCLLNKTVEQNYIDIYYFFKKSPLRWRLFKRQAEFLGVSKYRYKRPVGTRWIEHIVASTESYMHNLFPLIAYCDQQIAEPHNKSMKDVRARLQGMRKNVVEVVNIIFLALKLDVIRVLRPLTKMMQDNSLLTSEFITMCKMAKENISRMCMLFGDSVEDGTEIGIFEIDDTKELFPTTRKLLNEFSEVEEEIVPFRQTRNDTEANQNKFVYYHGYLLSGDCKEAIKKTVVEFVEILSILEESVTVRFSEIIDNPVVSAMAKLLDTRAYPYIDIEDLYHEVMIIYDHFEKLFAANRCSREHLKSELRVMMLHINTFLSNFPAKKCWPQVFSVKDSLAINNILHIVELSIAFPLSNAECERYFSFLWRLYTKERLSLGNDTIEALLRLRGDSDFTASNYDGAIEAFLSQHPDGTLRSAKRHVGGHNYPSKRKSTASASTSEPSLFELNDILRKITDINMDDISDDEWSEDDSDIEEQ